MVQTGLKNFFFIPLLIPFAFLSGAFVFNTTVLIICITTIIYLIINHYLFQKFKFLILFFILFNLTIFVSSLLSEFDSNGSTIRSLSYIRNLFFLLGCTIFFSNKKNYKNLMFVIFFLCFFLILFSIFQSIFHINLRFELINNNVRLSSLFEDELILGSQFLAFISVILFLNKFKKTSNSNLIDLVIIFLGLYLVIRSGERMVFFKYILLCFLYFVLIFRLSIKFKLLFSSIIIIAATTFILLNKNTYDRFVTHFFIEKFYPKIETTQLDINALKKITINEYLSKNQIYSNQIKILNNKIDLSNTTTLEEKKVFIENFINNNIYKSNSYLSINKYIDAFLETGHGVLFITATNIFKDYPLFGVGIKQFRNACNDYILIQENYNLTESVCSTHPHNYYLEVLSETGCFGMIFLTILITVIFFSNRKKLKNKLILFIPIFIYLWPFASTGSFFTSLNSGFFWFLISLYIIDDRYNYINE